MALCSVRESKPIFHAIELNSKESVETATINSQETKDICRFDLDLTNE